MKITIKGVDYTVPPLSLKTLRSEALDLIKRNDDMVKQAMSAGEASWEAIELRGKVIFAALKQEAADLTEDDVMSGLNTRNVNKLFNYVLGVSGMGEDEPAAAPAEPKEILGLVHPGDQGLN